MVNQSNPIQIHPKAESSIINAVLGENRISIVVGGTGCGKSTLVPTILLDNIGHPILCTQPRRLAVIAVSSHVAKQRNSTLGDEVGYHVGQNRVATNRTKLVFATAGILLEELKSNGLEALCKYKVVLIDECHERSPESDLCLAIIKSFMIKYPHANMRIILMSATFNQGKYVDYFIGLPGCDMVKTITLDSGSSIDAYYKQVQTIYMEDILKLIPQDIRTRFLKSFERLTRLDPTAEMHGDDGGKSLSAEMIIVICLLVGLLHKEEPIAAKFLIFAPTYRHLEQLHEQLTKMPLEDASLNVDVLHSSIDIEDCLAKMQSKIDRSNHHRKRHILLASAIADSSVTIPGVTCVIDSCRALEVKWNNQSEKHSAKTVWASKSICDQRKGRTGRTCPGRCFRLVNQSFFINRLENWDQPQIELASCRDEMLALLSSSNKIFANPQALLRKCLDPPPEASVNKAIQYLQQVGACKMRKVGNRETLVPTDLGRLLAALPYTIEDANMIVRGAQIGMLHEALVIVSILSTRPYPILHVFGESEINESNQQKFYNNVNPKDSKSVAIANFAAYLFWVVKWKKNIRQRAAKSRFLLCSSKFDEPDEYYNIHLFNSNRLYRDGSLISNDEKNTYDCQVWEWNSEIDLAHSEFCKKYCINPTSVKAIDANVNVAMNILYHKDHEPDWLRCQRPMSVWSKQFDSNVELGHNVFQMIYGHEKGNDMCKKLMQLQDPSSSFGQMDADDVEEETACIHFLNGHCSFGHRCRNSHSYTAPRPLCRFYLNGGCTNSSCPYSHTPRQSPKSTIVTIPPIYNPSASGGAISWFKRNASKLLLFGEGDFSFTKALISLNIFPSVVTSVEMNSASIASSTTNFCTTYFGVDATRCHSDYKLVKYASHVKACAWNFPYTGQDEDDETHRSLLSGAFLSVSVYLAKNQDGGSSSEAEFALALQGDQLSRWTVLQSAEKAGFELDWWDEFDHTMFPGYFPKRCNGETFPAQHTRFYVFRLSYP